MKKRSRKKQLKASRRTNKNVFCPDGVPIALNLDLLEPGMSVFVPAVNLRTLKSQMTTSFQSRGFTMKSCERIEGGILGMRFWRKS